eukprot:m.61793 g.61793  ORF g.61793 m.61793 type:complete len:407 (+) comp35022_c0_seq15:27-1247(+)
MGDSSSSAPVGLPFINDGSFLENFKRLQDAKTAEKAPTPSNDQNVDKKPSITPIKLKSKSEVPQKSGVVSRRPAAFEEEGLASPAELEQATKLATVVAQGGTAIERISLKTNKNQPEFRFLYDASLELCQFYRNKVAELSGGKVRSLAGTAEAQALLAEKGDNQKRKRSRWVNDDDIPDEESPAKVASTDKSERVDVDFMEQFKQSIAKAKMLALHKPKAKKSALEYDSDEDTEGGTWEHKLRASEMQKTNYGAQALTGVLDQGKHHLQDFLPMEKVQEMVMTEEAIRQGKMICIVKGVSMSDVGLMVGCLAARSDYQEQKLTESNIGYKMLAKSGWKEGQGLGTAGSGITAPVNKGRVTKDLSGLGASRPDEVAAGDTEFELYRKRMMAAYKYRPNPLNNPRRPY